jgi:MFS family permease
LTGAAEAGFFPGMVLYLSTWFPIVQRGRVLALFMAAIPLSGVVGGPLSGWVLSTFTTGQWGLSAWQWLFLAEGLPTVFLGIAAFFLLSDKPRNATWLTEDERLAVSNAMAEDERNKPANASDTFASVVRNPNVWMLGLIYFCIQSGVYAINFWLPSIIKASGAQSPASIGWLSAIPYLAAAFFMPWIGSSADRRRERRWHLSIPMLMGVGGLAIAAAFPTNIAVAIAGLTIATMGALSGLPMFWPLSSGFLTPAAAAGGVALINSTGQIAGFVSPYFVGWVKDATHSTDLALYFLAGVMLFGAILVLRIPASRVNR